MKKVPLIELNNGYKMPGFAFGTCRSTDDSCKNAVKSAIIAGYRHIDTAFVYFNEKQVGEAIREMIADGLVKREDIFLVTKLGTSFYDKVEEACRKSLDALGLDYIDLYLIHSPVSFRYVDDKTIYPRNSDGELDVVEYEPLDIWKQMEKLVEKGWVRSIGVSNFNSKQVEEIVNNCKIKPVCNQVECSPAANQRKLIKFCNDLRVVVTGYSPFGQRPDPIKKYPKSLYDEKVSDIGKKYGKSAAQVILRFCFEMGAIPIAKSVTKSRIIENFDIFDFKLTKDEVEYLDTFENFDERLVKFFELKKCKQYPFNIEF